MTEKISALKTRLTNHQELLDEDAHTRLEYTDKYLDQLMVSLEYQVHALNKIVGRPSFALPLNSADRNRKEGLIKDPRRGSERSRHSESEFDSPSGYPNTFLTLNRAGKP